MADQQPIPPSLAASIAATKVSYAQLGSCGLRVSVPILGGMSFGHKAWMPWVLDSEEEVFALLKTAYDCGLNTWDTANIYSNGISEAMIGRALTHLRIPRRKVVILTKVFATVAETPDVGPGQSRRLQESKEYVNQGGLSRAAIFNAVEASLGRLQTEYIDLLQIHRFDPDVPIEETMEALHDLVKAGKVRYIGASSMWTFQFAMMQFCAERHGWTKFVSMQNQYSLCYREEEREMIKYCKQTGVGIIPWAPLYRGNLARPVGAEETERLKVSGQHPIHKDMVGADADIINRVQEVAERNGWKMSQVALAWVIQKGAIPIVGFNKVERIHKTVDVKRKVLAQEDVEYLEELYQPKQVSGHV
ncbi:Aldo-keto reductase dtxS3 [Lasiodiplodia theobromae]|uniref:Aldo-keto reductase dtxS3 n=1 Tax=Lasiodiplodia theobromae TaxID=45133 RepID=A0A5N5CVY7_9PEZI|nr:Aldo-keto reductase dtxS3 [Lasiodiplodia theobromae]